MADKDLEIVIRTKAELAGAQAAEKQLESDIGRAKALGKEYGELERQLAKVRSATASFTEAQKETGEELNDLSPKTREYIKTLGEATEKGEKFNLTHREIHMLTHNLTRSMPELGHVLSELANPWLGLTLAVGAVVNQMVEYYQKTEEIKNDPGPDWESNAKKIEDVRTAYADAAVAAAAYERELFRIASRPISAEESYARQISQLSEFHKEETDLLSAQEKRQAAAIETAEHLGYLTHAQAVAAKLHLDETYAARRIALENQMAQAEITSRKKELADAQYRAHAAKEELPGMEKIAAGAGAADVRNQNILETAKANLAKALEERQKISDETGDAQAQLNAQGPLGSRNFLASQARARLAVVDDKQAINAHDIQMFSDTIKKAQANAPGLKDAANKANEDLEEVKSKLKAMVELVHTLAAQIPDAESKAGRQAAARGALGDIDNQTGAFKAAGDILKDQTAFQSAAAGADALNQGGQVTANQSNLIGALVQVLTALGQTQKQAMDAIAGAHNNTRAQQALIAQLQKSIKDLAAKIDDHKNIQ